MSRRVPRGCDASRRIHSGFTLVELMIVVGIIAIVAAVGYPSYQNSVRKTNRVDAMNTIMDTMVTIIRDANGLEPAA